MTRGHFSGLTSNISPLGSVLNFDAGVKKKAARHQCENHVYLQLHDAVPGRRRCRPGHVLRVPEVE